MLHVNSRTSADKNPTVLYFAHKTSTVDVVWECYRKKICISSFIVYMRLGKCAVFFRIPYFCSSKCRPLYSSPGARAPFVPPPFLPPLQPRPPLLQDQERDHIFIHSSFEDYDTEDCPAHAYNEVGQSSFFYEIARIDEFSQ